MNIFLSKKMRYFVTTMESLCFIKAADELCITRSPLVKLISELEAMLGGALFIRNYNELIPTALGKEVYSQVKPLQSKLLAFEKELMRKYKAHSFLLIFDNSYPYNIMQHVVTSIMFRGIDFTYTHCAVTNDILSKVEEDPFTIVLSLKDMEALCNITRIQFLDQIISVIVPEDTAVEHMDGQLVLPRLPLLLKNHCNVEEMKSWCEYLLFKTRGTLEFMEMNCDISGTMYAVSKNIGMTLLPEKYANIYHIHGTKCININNATITKTVFHNSHLADSKEVNEIITIIDREL